MKMLKLFSVVIVGMVLGTALIAQEEQLIIDPEISEYASVPVRGSKLVRSDTLPPDWKPGPTHYESFNEGIKRTGWPSGALIKGKAPATGKRWAVAVTRDAEEFNSALPEYRRLIAAGNSREAMHVLHISRQMNVSTRVEEFSGDEKIGDLPGEMNTFRFMLSTLEFKKYGGYLTFLTYSEDPKYPMIGIGQDIGETIHGEILVVTVEGKHGNKYGYAMEIIRARITEPEESENLKEE